jgi:hypothetical protein
VAANNAAYAATTDPSLVKQELLDMELQEGTRAAFVYLTTKKDQTPAEKEEAKAEMTRHAKYTAKVGKDRAELNEAYKKELSRVEGVFRSPADQPHAFEVKDARPIVIALLGPICLVMGVYVGIAYPTPRCLTSSQNETPRNRHRRIGIVETSINFPVANDRDALIGQGKDLSSF